MGSITSCACRPSYLSFGKYFFLYDGVFFAGHPVAMPTSVFIRELDGVIITGIDHLSDFRISYVRSIAIQLDCPSDNCLRQDDCYINKIPPGYVRLLLMKKLRRNLVVYEHYRNNVRSFYLFFSRNFSPLPSTLTFLSY